MKIADQIKGIRIQKHLTQEQMAILPVPVAAIESPPSTGIEQVTSLMSRS